MVWLMFSDESYELESPIAWLFEEMSWSFEELSLSESEEA
jgi:hypothetical protein